MRIVAGSARGRPLQGPKSATTIRPTADRVRETLFNILGQRFDGEHVLDLYAGTGALGLEAISRGAAKAVFVDQDREAQRLCRENAESLGFAAQVEVIPMPVARGAEALKKRGAKFQLVFADPPYAARVVLDILELVTRNGLLTPEGTLVIEHDKREEAPDLHELLSRIDQRKFGDTLVSFYRAGSA